MTETEARPLANQRPGLFAQYASHSRIAQSKLFQAISFKIPLLLGREQAITKVGLFTEDDHMLVNDNFLQIFVELPKLGPERGEDGPGRKFLRALRDTGKTDERQEEYADPALDQLFHASMYKHFNKEEQMKYDKEMGWPEDYIDNARNMALDAAEKAVAEKQRAATVGGLPPILTYGQKANWI